MSDYIPGCDIVTNFSSLNTDFLLLKVDPHDISTSIRLRA